MNAVQVSQPLIYEGYAGAFASFMATGNPNEHKITNATQPGVPELDTGMEYVIVSDGFENVGINVGGQSLEARCKFWASVAGSVPI